MADAVTATNLLPGEYEYRGTIYHNKTHPNMHIDMLESWTVDPSDVVIATYPKSGTTWMTSIVLQIYDQNEANPLRMPYLEMKVAGHRHPGVEIISEFPPPRILKTHLSYEFLERKVENDNLKVIVVVRNPKDTITSYYYMYKQKVRKDVPGNFHDFFQIYKAGNLRCGDVFEWTLAWWGKRSLHNVLIIKYEDMISNCATEIQKVCKFLGKDLPPSRIEEIVKDCSFEVLKSKQFLSKYDNPGGAATVDVNAFFRKGVIGDWKNHFTPEESEYVDSLAEKYFVPVGLYFDAGAKLS